MATEESLKSTGAPAALKFLEAEEAALREAYTQRKGELKEAIDSQVRQDPQDDGTDYGKLVASAQINFNEARKIWHETLKALREFDRQVEPAKRDASEKITRDEGERIFRNWAIAARGMIQNLSTTVCQDVLICKTPVDVHHLIHEKFSAIVKTSIADAVREEHLPKWCAEAVEEVL